MDVDGAGVGVVFSGESRCELLVIHPCPQFPVVGGPCPQFPPLS
jgi:hypothetical protein